MHIVLVEIKVKQECVDDFIAATIENAKNSRLESGVMRFDFIQQKDDPYKFSLIEVYVEADDQLKHRETDHYKKWRDTVEPMMAEARKGTKFINISPDDIGWGK